MPEKLPIYVRKFFITERVKIVILDDHTFLKSKEVRDKWPCVLCWVQCQSVYRQIFCPKGDNQEMFCGENRYWELMTGWILFQKEVRI